jgi:hypothetical protein
MTMKAFLESTLEMIAAEFLFQLLVGLLADPTRLQTDRLAGGSKPFW